MSTYEHDLLSARFAALAPRPLPGDWDDVLDRAGAVGRDRRRLAPSLWRGGRRRKLVVALAVAVLVTAVATAAYGTVRVLFLDKGFIGLPPIGATASAPESGEPVLSLYGRSTASGSPLSRIWVYADGRIIWDREGQIAEGANALTSGLLEQRLTPEGVEALRSEVLSRGLFEHDAAFISERGHLWLTVEARNGDRLVRVYAVHPRFVRAFEPNIEKVTLTTPTAEQLDALERVDALLRDPQSWLPASAWADRKNRAYVASRYAVCVGAWPQPLEPENIVSLLPSSAQRLLGAKDMKRFDAGENHAFCAALTTEEARTLVASLSGLEDEGPGRAYRLGYRVDVPGQAGETAQIWVEPYLPHGEFVLFSPGR